MKEKNQSPKAIICLGGGIKNNGEPTKNTKSRLNKTLEKFNSGKFDFVIISSKAGYRENTDPPVSEARKGKKYLAEKGIPYHKLLIEEASLDTIGNAYFTRVTHIDPAQIKDITVITNEFHLKRTKLLFNLVYGPKYSLDFVGTKNNITGKSLERRESHEQEMCKFYKKIFRNVKPGDLKALHKYLFTKNPAYADFIDNEHNDLTKKIEKIWERKSN